MAHVEAASAVAYHARIRIVGSAAEVQRHQRLVSAFFREFVSADNFPDGRMREEPSYILNAVTDESRSKPYRTMPAAGHHGSLSPDDAAGTRPAPSSSSSFPGKAEWQRKRPSQPATYLVCLELAPAVEIGDNGSAFPIVDDDDDDESDDEPSDNNSQRRWRFAGGMVVEYYPCSTCALLAYLFVRRQFRGPIQIVTATAPSPQASPLLSPALGCEAACGAVVVGSLERPGSGDAPAAVLLTTAAALLLHGPEGMKAVVLRLRASFGHCQAVLFEANHPSRTSLSNDNMPPHKRLGFYRRMGARQLPVDYIQPPLHDGAPPTRSMLLGCFPQFQPDASRLSLTAVMRFFVEFTASTDRDLSQPIYTDEDVIADLATIDRFEARASQGFELSADDAAAEYSLRYRTAEGLPLLQEMWQGLLQRRRGSASAKGSQTSCSTNVTLQAFGAALVPTPSQSQSQASDSQSSEPQSQAQLQAQAQLPTFLMAHPPTPTTTPHPAGTKLTPSVMLAHLPMTVEQARQQSTFLAWQFTSLEALGRTGIPVPLPLSAIAALGAYLSISLEYPAAAKAEQPTLIWLAVSDTLTVGDGTEGALAEALCALEADTVDTLGMIEPSVCHGRVVVVPACLTPAKGGVILLPQATGGPRIVSGGPSTSGLDNNPLPVFVAAQLAQLFSGADGATTDSSPGGGSSSCKLWLGPREGSELRPRGVLRSLASIIEGGGGGLPAIEQPPLFSLEGRAVFEGDGTSEGGSDVVDVARSRFAQIAT